MRLPEVHEILNMKALREVMIIVLLLICDLEVLSLLSTAHALSFQ
jgi:hypothetical protein